MRLLLAVVLVVLAAPVPADACVCITYPLKQLVRESKKSFTGVVTSETRAPSGEWILTVAVDGVYRGKVYEVEIIGTGTGGTNCTYGPMIPLGVRWLFVSDGSRRDYNVCYGTRELTDDVTKKLKKIRKPKQPLTPQPSKED